jgi:hypothetical protein
MIDFQLRWDDFADLQEYLDRLKSLTIDMRPLGDLIAQQLFEENREARLAGLDRFGGPLIDVLPETLRRRGPGVPLAPKGDASRVISNLSVEVSGAGMNQIQVRAFWTGIPWLRFHVEGVGRLRTVRDILGTSPETDQWISDVFTEYVRQRALEYLGGQAATGFTVADLPVRRPAR